MKQTAVDWLIDEIIAKDWWYLPESMKQDIIEQAKAMQKEQIIESYLQGCVDISKDDNIFPRETSEQYYNETYKS